MVALKGGRQRHRGRDDAIWSGHDDSGEMVVVSEHGSSVVVQLLLWQFWCGSHARRKMA